MSAVQVWVWTALALYHRTGGNSTSHCLQASMLMLFILLQTADPKVEEVRRSEEMLLWMGV
jgi:hypothetical protein